MGKKCQVCQVFTPTLSNTDIFIQVFKKQGRSMNNPVIFKLQMITVYIPANS